MAEESERFHWYQCSICGKLLDSEEAHREHETKCKERFRTLILSAESALPWNSGGYRL